MSGITYVCKAGETFDSIALKLYANERYANVLLTANPSQCHMLTLEGGEVLTVPTLDLTDDDYDSAAVSTAAPWRG